MEFEAARSRMHSRNEEKTLRYGWTTGCCATAAAKAAFEALVTGEFPDPIDLALPNGACPAFALAIMKLNANYAEVGIVKDAGDDPDVTHGALVISKVRPGRPGTGITFEAGAGVGTVTKPGLPIPPGEPAINPVPRKMIREAIIDRARYFNRPADAIVEITIPNGENIAKKTLNPRLGILGGLSILGTTGIVVPYSCSAWIHSIHRGVDVARAAGLSHIVGATGSISEDVARRRYDLPSEALIDMGDFVGGFLKYLKKAPVRVVTIAGGVAKMTKLAQGLLDLHSGRGRVDFGWLAKTAIDSGGSEELAEQISRANTATEANNLAVARGIDLATPIADAAWQTAANCVGSGAESLEILVVNRDGNVVVTTGMRALHEDTSLNWRW